MSRYRCNYRGANFDYDTVVAGGNCVPLFGFSPTEDVEQPKPPGALPDPFRNADPIGSEWTSPDVPPVGNRPGLLERVADILDTIPTVPGFQPVPKSECAWCRVTKKAGPWVGLVVVGLLVAWISRKLFQ